MGRDVFADALNVLLADYAERHGMMGAIPDAQRENPAPAATGTGRDGGNYGNLPTSL